MIGKNKNSYNLNLDFIYKFQLNRTDNKDSKKNAHPP